LTQNKSLINSSIYSIEICIHVLIM